jgi:hypothetical protein
MNYYICIFISAEYPAGYPDGISAQYLNVFYNKNKKETRVQEVSYYRYKPKYIVVFKELTFENYFLQSYELLYLYLHTGISRIPSGRIYGKSNPVSGRTPAIKKGRIIRPDNPKIQKRPDIRLPVIFC